MACRTINLRDRMAGSNGGGAWSYLGYSAIEEGTPGAGGSSIGTLTGDNPAVNFENKIPGYYHFQYCNGLGECEVCEILMVKVVAKGTAGTGGTFEYCVSITSTLSLSALLVGESSGGKWMVNPGSPNSPGGSFNAGAGTFNLNGISSPGSFHFDYVIDVEGNENFDPVNCLTCKSVATIIINVTEACSAGVDNTIQVSSTTGSFSLFSSLLGTPDPGGSWTQLTGSTVTINNGYLGNVNLNSAQGCGWSFRYTCSGPTGCTTTAIVTVVKNPNFAVTISLDGDTLESSTSGCTGTVSYQWQELLGSTLTNIPGATSATRTGLVNQRLYRLVASCDSCPAISNIIQYMLDCLCNQPGFSFGFNAGTDCLSIIPTGENCADEETDVFEIRIPAGTGSWITHDPEDNICGCDLRKHLDVSPTCSATATNINIGYNSVSRCTGSIDRVLIKFGNQTLETNVGGDMTTFTKSISKSDFINLYNRTAKMIVRLNLGSGSFLFQEINFYYSGGTGSGDNCSSVAITKLNFPKKYNSVQARRTVSYENGCPDVQFTNTWSANNDCDNVYVVLTKVNVGGANSISGEVFNCASPSRQWYKDGVLISGQIGFTINTDVYGDGFYEMRATCGSCIKWGSLNISSCSVAVALSINTGTGVHTATAINCAGTKTYYWERQTTTGWVIDSQTTTTSNTNAFTPSQSGNYRIRMVCAANSCTASQEFSYNFSCSVTVSLVQSGDNLVATSTGCSGSKKYTFFRWNGSAFVQVNTQTTSSNSVTYTPTQSGLYLVEFECLANGCPAESQTPFFYDCSVNLSIAQNGSTYTGTFTGCTGSRRWVWSRWNGTSMVVVRDVTNSASTDSYVATQDVLHELVVTCLSNGCYDNESFVHESAGCAVVGSIVVTLPNLTGSQTGCNGAPSWTWYFRATPGSGSWGTPISTSQTINTNTWGPGEYRMDVNCGGCFDTKYYTLSPCSVGVTINCSNTNPYLAVGTPSGGTYQWQFSFTGTGWIGLGTSATQMPTMGTGWYRCIYTVSGCTPIAAQCYYTASCAVTATLASSNDKCDWLCKTLTGGTTSVQFWHGGSNVVSGSWSMSNSGGRAAFKAAIESWLTANNHGGTVTITHDSKGDTIIRIECTKASPDKVVFVEPTANTPGYNSEAWFGMCGRTCDYEFTVPSLNVQNLSIGEHLFVPAMNPYTNESAFIAAFNDFMDDHDYSGTIDIDEGNGVIVITTNVAVGAMNIPANLPININATRSGCGSTTRIYPTITLTLGSCSGTQSITWRYRPNSGAPWTNIQTGGLTLSTCTDGQYQAIGTCGDCPFTSNIITIS